MAKFKLDLLLRQLDAGASEVYYIETENRTTAKEIGDELAAIRIALSPEIASVQGYRITPLAPTGIPSGKQRTYNKEAAAIVGVAGTTRSEQDVSYIVQHSSTDEEVAATQHLRFVPGEWVVYTAAGVWTPIVPFPANSTNYINELTSGSFFMRRFNGSLETNPNSSRVAQVKFDPDGLMSVVLEDEIDSLLPGQRVKIIGYKGIHGRCVNGFYHVLGITGLEVFLDKVSCDFKASTSPGAGASLFLESYLFTAIARTVFVDLGKRDTGRSFFLERGRRSKRRLCRLTPAVVS